MEINVKTKFDRGGELAFFTEDVLFPTKAEAQAECDKRNEGN